MGNAEKEVEAMKLRRRRCWFGDDLQARAGTERRDADESQLL